MSQIEFQAWPKIPRLNRDIIITEKIDGTNAAVIIQECEGPHTLDDGNSTLVQHEGRWFQVAAQSRTRIITPGKSTDNFGFAGWVFDKAQELVAALGEGRHYGEWFGGKIQRGYGLTGRAFALFNVSRWEGFDFRGAGLPEVTWVPVLYRGPYSDEQIEWALALLHTNGSYITEHDYDNPEGIVVFHTAARSNFKVLLENDDVPKGVAV